jgi:SAM-dependent methyltransferase
VTEVAKHLMDHPLAYRLWQAPFAARKLAPFLRHIAGNPPASVLDVGCGPGTNASCFPGCDYLGLDINPRYIASATRRYGPRFRLADVTRDDLGVGGAYDCILINSLLHHLPDPAVERVLARVSSSLAPGGTVHVLDLVLPEQPSVARLLTRIDRGYYPRPAARWRELFTAHFTLGHCEPYSLRLGGVALWKMIYLAGSWP